MPPRFPLLLIPLLSAGAVWLSAQSAPRSPAFRSGIDLVNVTATVTDDEGRFVTGLNRDDFLIYEDEQAQTLTHFSRERVPLSLGIALDSSASMTPQKLSAARAAIDRMLFELLGDQDELFVAHFSSRTEVLQSWTTDRSLVSRAVATIRPAGATAIYDAIAAVIPTAETGQNPKKALMVISDGNDTSSATDVRTLRQRILESEILVYALGVDGASRRGSRPPRVEPRVPFPPTPFPFPGGRRGLPRVPTPPVIEPRPALPSSGDRLNAEALRQITDDTGGRTEVVRGFDDLEEATSRLADELSRQYFMGYARTGERDGQWRSIRVTVRNNPHLHVRARRGYFAP